MADSTLRQIPRQIQERDDVLQRYKILLMGCSGVGKTSILLRYVDTRANGPNYVATIGEPYSLCRVTL